MNSPNACSTSPLDSQGIAETTVDEQEREFVLKETAVPMDNGQSLTLIHWHWLIRESASVSRDEYPEWFREEITNKGKRLPLPSADSDERITEALAWMRKESPSASVLWHVSAVISDRYERELDRREERLQDVHRALQACY